MENGSDALTDCKSLQVSVYHIAISKSQAGVPFAVRKRAIDMSQIHTIGKDNLDTTFSGNTHSLYSMSFLFIDSGCHRWE